MKNFTFLALIAIALTSCTNELKSDTKTYTKKTTLPCTDNCPKVEFKIPEYSNGEASDSINANIFKALREIVQFGEDQYKVNDYQALANAFVASYEEMQKEESEREFGWEATVTGKEIYRSDKLLNVELESYTFTGGAHGYGSKRSMLFDIETGKHVPNDKLFKDMNAFQTFAESKFRAKYKIPAPAPINSKGFMFEDEKFALPMNIFFTNSGLLLHYNPYEIASYAEGSLELLLPYTEVDKFLAVK
ncbi:MAG: DUF3298/DUF4163 domain-containing protein [Flavobacterium sp.]|uniref:DUF3298 and DUF4163 domain-containing protein n=1 Tax=Flavobacterium sp. TaxID=239 RepID=UPI001206FE01|nr:DUF3298 and DUF4163 domain-containing protein [Flavobacterium sp.]RZJ68095.1 MAG: DUF3298/DUF4163 domain-containing protein [Flavobacterium sp.]